ncbi:hypothetical protein ACWCQX_46390, partial [Streptomyces sp. NPDC002346]
MLRTGGAKPKGANTKKKKAKKAAAPAGPGTGEAGSSTGPGTATESTPATAGGSVAATNPGAGGQGNGTRLTPENVHELVSDAYDQWRARNPGGDRSTPESRAEFVAEAAPSLLDFAEQVTESDPAFVFDGGVIAFLLAHQLHPDSPDALSPATLSALARARGVMDVAARSPELAKAFDDRPWLIARLAGHPDLLDTLGDPDLQVEVEPLLRDGAAVTRILGDRDALRELETDRNLRHIVLRNHRVVMGLDGNLELVRLVMGHDQSSLTSYLVADIQQFAGLLTDLDAQGPDGKEELSRVLGAMKDNLDLQYAVYENPEALADPEAMHRLLTDHPLLSAMRSHPAQIKTVLRVPGMLAAAHRDPATLLLLDSDPFLSDVLLDVPELGTDLAADPGLLRAAYANPRLAERLSEQPDALADALASKDRETLERALSSAAPQPAEAGATRPDAGNGTGNDFQRILRAALEGRTDLVRVMIDEPDLGTILTDNPDLLSAPHEYRRLLHPTYGADARFLLLNHGDALLVPGVLRSLLRHPWAQAMGRHRTDDLGVLAQTLRGRPELAEAYHRSGAWMFKAMLHANSYAVATATDGFVTAAGQDGLLLSVFNENQHLVRVLHEAPHALNALTAGDTALLELAARFPLVVNAVLDTPDAIRAGERHAAVLKALAAAAARTPETEQTPGAVTTRTPGHWSRLLLGDELLAALAADEAAPLLRLLATDAEVFNAVVERPAVTQLLQRHPQRLTGLVDDRAALLSEIKGAGSRTLTETGLAIAPRDAARLRTLAQPHEAARNVLRGAQDDTGLDVLDSLHEAYEEIPGLRDAAAADEGLLHLLYANKELLPTLRHRPDLLAVLTDPSKHAQRALHLNTELTAALRTNGPLHHAFVQDSFLVEGLARDWEAGEWIARNRNLFRFVRIPHLQRAFGHKSPAQRFIEADEVMTDALLRDGQQLLPSLRDNDPFFEELLELRGDGAPERVHRVDAVVRAVTADADGPLLEAVARTPGLARILYDAPVLTAVLAAHPKAFLHVDEVRGFLSDPALVAGLDQAHTVTDQILASRDLLTAVADEPRLPGAMLKVPGFADLLVHHPGLHPLGAMGLTADVLADPDLVPALHGLQGLAEALIAVPDLSGQLRKPGVLTLVRAHRVLVREAHRQTRLWGALDRMPALVTAANADPGLLARAGRRANLLDSLAGASPELTGEDLRDLFAAEGFATLLNEQPTLAKAVLGDPELLRYGLAQPHFEAALRALGTGKKGKKGNLSKTASAGSDAIRGAVDAYGAKLPAPATTSDSATTSDPASTSVTTSTPATTSDPVPALAPEPAATPAPPPAQPRPGP